ncbi:Hypp6311 [Branchiostoma lanceolatum]|uniref:Hypp6311 protein n=1 Tax=Branchiostoma lanceolatum TaxID=7740 RepID=A0A8K0E965_BRALA|nr:Hypp6311 [Branchiostoma lanceolatum]
MFGHILRMPTDTPAHQALDFALIGCNRYSSRKGRHCKNLLSLLRTDLKERESPGSKMEGTSSNCDKVVVQHKFNPWDFDRTEVLVKNVAQYVNFDMDSRRPKTLPDWVRERYAHLTSRPRPTTVNVFEMPACSTPFVHSIRVPASHIDWNRHVGQQYYYSYCFDCAALGARNGMYSTVRGDIFRHNVREISVLYQREALEGDLLTVESWEDEGKPGTLKFQVKKGSDGIVQMAIAFNTHSESKL